MATTVEKNPSITTVTPPGSRRIELPDREIELHEMPDLTRTAPEVEYAPSQPRRSWLRYLAVGVVVAAVALGAGFAINAWMTGRTTTPEYSWDYSLAREHLAQAPGGFAALGPFTAEYGLAREHLAQAPLPVEVTYADSLAMEHVAQTPGGFPFRTQFTADYSLAREHLAQAPLPVEADYPVSLVAEHVAQTPGGFPEVPTYRASVSLAEEHLAQTPGGFPG